MMPAGSIIVCPNPKCNLEQIKSTNDIGPGNQLKDAGWESINYDMEFSIRMACPSCATLWAKVDPKTGQHSIHIKGHGWTFPMSRKKLILLS